MYDTHFGNGLRNLVCAPARSNKVVQQLQKVDALFIKICSRSCVRTIAAVVHLQSNLGVPWSFANTDLSSAILRAAALSPSAAASTVKSKRAGTAGSIRWRFSSGWAVSMGWRLRRTLPPSRLRGHGCVLVQLPKSARFRKMTFPSTSARAVQRGRAASASGARAPPPLPSQPPSHPASRQPPAATASRHQPPPCWLVARLLAASQPATAALPAAVATPGAAHDNATGSGSLGSGRGARRRGAVRRAGVPRGQLRHGEYHGRRQRFLGCAVSADRALDPPWLPHWCKCGRRPTRTMLRQTS